VFDIVILLTTCVVNLSLGLLVYVRNPKLKASIAFGLTGLFTSLWAVSNYLTGSLNVSLGVNGLANKVAFFSALVAMGFALRFVVNFVPGTYLGFGKRLDRVLTGSGVLMAMLSFTSWVAGDVTSQNGQLHFSIGVLLPAYITLICTFIFLVIRTLYRIITDKKGHEKQQAVYVLIAFSVPPFLILLTNAVLPSLTHSWHTAAFGPAFTILMMGTIAYAMVRHRLFDIRFAVARSFAYALSVLTIVALYAVSALGIAYSLFGISVTLDKQIFLVLFSVVTALLFQPLKKFFNRASNRLFYRDAYEPQDVLDRLSALLVGTVNMDEVKRGVNEILYHTVRPSSLEFLLTSQSNLNHQQEVLLKQLLHINYAVVSVDDLTSLQQDALRASMQKQGAALAVRLRTTHEDLGYMLYGYRRSGVPYFDADQRLLSVVADELALGLQNAIRFEEIQNFNITLQQKIEDATKKLRQTNDKLRALDQIKDDFISMSSHQLRTPLTSIKGYVSMVLDGDAGPLTPLQRKLLLQAFVSSQRMVYLISDLLNVSRLKTGKFIIDPTPTNLASVVKDEVEQLQETAKGRNLVLHYDKPSHFPMYMLDETKLRQVIMNFLDNAIYYTPSGGEITAQLVEKPLSIEFTVTDTGIGVPKHEQHHLFSKFYRAPNAQRARPDGTGLGLYMAKKVIMAQGGAILFKSQEGQGSSFGFTFAKEKIAAPPPKPKLPHAQATQTEPLTTPKSAAK
jgi:signal transduction histidine kinase